MQTTTPHSIYVSPTAVYVLWTERGPFVVLREDGTTDEQWRLPNENGTRRVYPSGVLVS
jgi:hypothetical protein